VPRVTRGSVMKKKTGKAYYMISAVAQKYTIHPQTLRLYEREGLLKPSRTEGNTRLYSETSNSCKRFCRSPATSA
jgi:hypothetical protein